VVPSDQLVVWMRGQWNGAVGQVRKGGEVKRTLHAKNIVHTSIVHLRVTDVDGRFEAVLKHPSLFGAEAWGSGLGKRRQAIVL
jgi:hypothetical protein